MKFIIYLTAFIALSLPACAQQNMVVNGSFEYHTGCPPPYGTNSAGYYATGWFDYHASPDYFHTCSNVPNALSGYQYPADGQAFIGGTGGTGIGECAGGTMTPLTIGNCYEVSLSAVLSDGNVGNNALGVLFIANGPTVVYNFLQVPQPQLRYSNYGILTDTQNWHRLSNLFVADSVYSHLVIGCFGIFSGFAASTGTFGGGYYFIDSVVVKRFKLTSISPNDTVLCAGDTFSVNYLVNAANVIKNSNVFSVQLSDINGIFSSPVVIGTRNSNSSNIIHCTLPNTLATGGYYKIRMVSDSPYVVSDTAIIGIGHMAAKPAATGNSPVCEGSTYNMSVSGATSGYTFTWTGPGFSGTGASLALLNATNANAGNYIVTAHYFGCEAKDTTVLVVNPIPAKPNAGSNTPVCVGSTLNLTSAFASGLSCEWAGPGAFTSTLSNPSVSNTTFLHAGNYILSVKNSYNCISKDTEVVVINPIPQVLAGNNSPLCEGVNLSLFNNIASGTFSWTGPNSYTSSAQNPIISNVSTAASGDYIVSVTLNGCTGKDTTTVTVKPNPITPLTNSNTPVCVGGTINFTAASNAGASYSWTGPNSFSAAVQNPTRINIGLSDAGAYSVIATLNGCVSPAGSTTVVVNPLPFVTIYPTPSDSICQGSPVTFVALPANTSTPSYKWTRNSSPSALGTGSALTSSTINNKDIIRCEMTEPSKCGMAYKDTSNEVHMTVLPWLAPSVSITSNPTTPLSPYELITFTAIPVNAGNNPKYQWQRNSSDVIGATSSTWATQQLSNNDSISVILTSDYKCPQPKTAGSNKIKVIVLTGVDEVKGANRISLYPNPNNGSFTIKGNVNSNKEVTIQIVNAVGQLVYETRTFPKNKELDEQVNVQHLSSGVYVLKIKTESINIKFKIE